MYSNSSKRKEKFKTLLQRTSVTAGHNTLIACADFNAMNSAWGYNEYTARGRDLYQNSMELDFTLITDPLHPTRIAYFMSSDTTPDLMLVKNDVWGAIT
ncbi:hypothetical protein HPB51_017633 [Rhipicephalus microplus]|uniref:Endonuclease/exonuclease/phosphatase domain-containing protein n=1 Tax=Rhipicephalus microplus TaxID=6941 RepID=A0A9J6EI53_RHIMP|nr:hypothetical protein HPB51_017633 [Rhipicephalus microplus]